VVVSAAATLVIIEGVGASRRKVLTADRPWERAIAIVSGTPQIDYDPEVVVAPAKVAYARP
jgi:hypothetical protein